MDQTQSFQTASHVRWLGVECWAVSDARLPKFLSEGKRPVQAATTSNVPMPPLTTEKTGLKSWAISPDSKPPISLEAPTKMAETAWDPAPHLVGSAHLRDDAADDHADVVEGTGQHQHQQREPEVLREAKENGCRAKAGHAPE